jgi:hypothetical protein
MVIFPNKKGMRVKWAIYKGGRRECENRVKREQKGSGMKKRKKRNSSIMILEELQSNL